MIRRIAVVVPLFVLATLGAALPSAHAQGGGGCQLQGTASFKPGLGTSDAKFTYNFGGTLSSCASNENSIASGVVSAGQLLALKGEKFQEPVPSGTGSCGDGTTNGLAIVKWDNGAYTIIKYSTQSVTGGVELMGDVVPALTMKAVHPKRGQPKSTTIKTTLYSGAGGNTGGVQGALTFSPDDPTACAAGGVASAAINGFTGIGSIA